MPGLRPPARRNNNVQEGMLKFVTQRPGNKFGRRMPAQCLLLCTPSCCYGRRILLGIRTTFLSMGRSCPLACSLCRATGFPPVPDFESARRAQATRAHRFRHICCHIHIEHLLCECAGVSAWVLLQRLPSSWVISSGRMLRLLWPRRCRLLPFAHGPVMAATAHVEAVVFQSGCCIMLGGDLSCAMCTRSACPPSRRGSAASCVPPPCHWCSQCVLAVDGACA